MPPAGAGTLHLWRQYATHSRLQPVNSLAPWHCAHLPLVVVASPHQNSTWSNLCMGNRSERGLWRCGEGEGTGAVRWRSYFVHTAAAGTTGTALAAVACMLHYQTARCAASPTTPPTTGCGRTLKLLAPTSLKRWAASAAGIGAPLPLAAAGSVPTIVARGDAGTGSGRAPARIKEATGAVGGQWRCCGARNCARWRPRQKQRLAGGGASRGFVSCWRARRPRLNTSATEHHPRRSWAPAAPPQRCAAARPT